MSIDVSGYKHNYKGFFLKHSHAKFFKIGENDHNSRCSCKPCENSLPYSLSLLVKSFEEEIQLFEYYVDTSRG